MAVRVSSTDILTTTVSSTAGIVDPVASGITGWSPGHSDTSGTFLDCCHITGRRGNCRIVALKQNSVFSHNVYIPSTVMVAESEKAVLDTVHL